MSVDRPEARAHGVHGDVACSGGTPPADVVEQLLNAAGGGPADPAFHSQGRRISVIRTGRALDNPACFVELRAGRDLGEPAVGEAPDADVRSFGLPAEPEPNW